VIYFIQENDTGNIKIGYTASKCADSRLKALQTGNPERLTVLATFQGDERAERWMHAEFSQFRVAGEWFRPAAPLIKFIIDTVREVAECRKNVEGSCAFCTETITEQQLEDSELYCPHCFTTIKANLVKQKY